MKEGLILLVTLGLLFIPLVAYGIPSSIGIVADGVNWTNGALTPYEINTNGIAGSVQIHSISTNPPKPGASLQLNAILHVTTTNRTEDYFIQNIFRIYNTNDQTANFENNVWSLSKPVNSSGICEVGNQPCYPYLNDRYYAKTTEFFTYQLPFSTSLVMTEDVVPDHFVEISFMHIENGKANLYDHYYLPIPNVKSASFLINKNPSSHTFYVAGLVWAGYGNGSSAYFDSMDSILNLQYEDTSSNTWKPFPNYSSYGYVSTAETAQNIYSVIEPNFPGQALVELGNDVNQNNLPSSTMSEPQTNPPTINTPNNSQLGNMIKVDGTSLSVKYSITNGNVLDIKTMEQRLSLIVSVNSVNDGTITLQLPRSLIDSKINSGQDDAFIILIDGAEVKPQSESANNDFRNITVQFLKGDQDIEIIGTHIVPEFGTIASAVFLIGIIATMIVSARVEDFPKSTTF